MAASRNVEFAQLAGVEYDEATDRVFVKFEVFDEKYKDFALRIATREDIQFNIVGEKLEFEERPEE